METYNPSMIAVSTIHFSCPILRRSTFSPEYPGWLGAHSPTLSIAFLAWVEARVLHCGKGLSPTHREVLVPVQGFSSGSCQGLIKACHTLPGTCLHSYSLGAISLR